MSDENDFKLGDRVQLKSGGPVMTVAPGGNENSVTCIWFSEKKDAYETHSFNRGVVELVSRDDDHDLTRLSDDELEQYEALVKKMVSS